MKTHNLFLGLIFSLFSFFFFSQNAWASHAASTQIEYECLGGDTFLVRLIFINDCAGISAPTNISVSASSNCGNYNIALLRQPCPPGPPGGQICEIGLVCPSAIGNTTCNGGNLPGYQRYVYEGTAYLQPCAVWVLTYSLCCRNASITNLTNPGSQNMYVTTTLNNLHAPCNNSPKIGDAGLPVFCAGVPAVYTIPVTESDGDSIAFSLVNPRSGSAVNIPYITPTFNPNHPFNVAGGFCLNSATGTLSFTPIGNQIAVVVVQVDEYRNGTWIGSVQRDLLFHIVNCGNNAPSLDGNLYALSGGFASQTVDSCLTGYPYHEIQVCGGSQLTFELRGSDPDGDSITFFSNASQILPGAVFSVNYIQPDSIVANFSWTPLPTQAGEYRLYILLADNGCPYAAKRFHLISIRVLGRTSAGPDLNYCPAGGPVQLNAIGGTQFSWSPTTGLDNPNIANPLASPSVTTQYIVTSNLNVPCVNSDTITVFVVPDFTYTISPDDTICRNGSAILSVNPDPAHGPYQITWSPAQALSSTTGNQVVANPIFTTTYSVEMVSASGCQIEDDINVFVSGLGQPVSIFLSEDTICPGNEITLTISGLPQSCGPTMGLNCNPAPGLTQLGLGGTFNNSTTSYPAVFGNFYEGAKHQILYQGSDFLAAGLSGGIIYSLGFDVAQVNGTNMFCEFSIKIGITALTGLTNFQPNLQTVYTPRTINIQPGLNMFVLDQPFSFSQGCNLIVEVCFNNDGCQTTWTQNSQTYYTTTPYTSVVYYRADNNPNLCSSTNPTGTSNQRPNLFIQVCSATGLIPGQSVLWTGPGITNPTSPTTTAIPPGTATYEITIQDGNGCTTSNQVQVVVDSSVGVFASGDTNLCAPGAPVQLSAQVWGNPVMTLSCGPDNLPCTGPTTIQAGTGTSLTTTTTPFAGNFHDTRVQYLYWASQLNAAGLNSGIISEIAFDIAIKQSFGAFENLTVKMGCTNLNFFTGFIPGLSQVMFTPSYTTTNGWNVFTLDQTFSWDGVSNLVIEICVDGNSYVGDDVIRVSTTTFSSVVYQNADFTNGCNLSNHIFGQLLPNIRIGSCSPPAGTPFTYNWSPGATLSDSLAQNPVATPTGPVVYTVGVDFGHCFAYDRVTVSFGDGIEDNAQISHPTCSLTADGSIILNPTGGVPPYSISWSNGSTDVQISGLAIGNYSVSITDQRGCIFMETYSLSEGLPIGLGLLVSQPVCYTDLGTASVNPFGGTPPYGISWSNGSTSNSIQNLMTGSYGVTVTDQNNCSAEWTFYIQVPDPLVLQITVTPASCPTCANGIASGSLSGGVWPSSYEWSNGVTTAQNTGLLPGIYTLTVIDLYGCSVSQSVTVPVQTVCSPINTISTTRISLTSARFNWPPQSQFHGYRIRATTINSSVWTNIDVSNPNQSFIDVSSLQNGVTYKWQIAVKCNSAGTNYTSWSPIDTFTTGCYEADPLSVPLVTSNAARLQWTRVYGCAGYVIQGRIAGAGPGGTISLNVAGSANIFKDVYGLSPNTAYEFRVRTWCDINGVNKSNWTPWFPFMTNPRLGDSDMNDGDLSAQFKVAVYPNPSDGRFFLSYSTPEEQPLILRVFDRLGRMVLSEELPVSLAEITHAFSLESFASGVYLLRAESGNRHVSLRLMKD